jgi:hypothetical protein
MTTQTTTITTYENIFEGSVYRVKEFFNASWEPRCKPFYMVERSRCGCDDAFFSIYTSEDKERALQLAGLGC